LKKENSSLEAKIHEHEIAIGVGAFNPAVSRVLEIKDSPASRHQAVRQHMLDSLKEENAALLKTVTQLQQRQPRKNLIEQTSSGLQGEEIEVALNDDTLIPAETFKRLKEDYDRLQEEMDESSLRSKRLKQSWTLKADEFLDAVRSLLGYKVDFLD